MQAVGSIQTAEPKRMLEDGLLATAYWDFPSSAVIIGITPFITIM